MQPTPIDILLTRSIPFALYRYPGSTPSLIWEETATTDSLSAPFSFLIAPFSENLTYPSVTIKAHHCIEGIEAIDSLQMAARTDKESHPRFGVDTLPISSDSRQAYHKAFTAFSKALKENCFEKLVLSHRRVFARPSEFSPLTLFRKAIHRYPTAFVALFYTPQSGLWLCASPELLLSEENGNGQTVALAGTMRVPNAETETLWNEKNRREQALVAQYIAHTLLVNGCQTRCTSPQTVQAGNVMHLRSSFTYRRYPTSIPPLALAKKLHPTPAVCGLPKDEAKTFIEEHEGYARGYYSGFLGFLASNRCELYMNLRCMEIGQEKIALYAGGGLLESSQEEAEWREIEAKLETMHSLL